jgi:hypothetical protein
MFFVCYFFVDGIVLYIYSQSEKVDFWVVKFVFLIRYPDGFIATLKGKTNLMTSQSWCPF